jgi:hypothetical protein
MRQENFGFGCLVLNVLLPQVELTLAGFGCPVLKVLLPQV